MIPSIRTLTCCVGSVLLICLGFYVLFILVLFVFVLYLMPVSLKCLFLMASSAFSSVVLCFVFHITPSDKNISYVDDKNDIPVINPRGCHSPSSEHFCTPLVY